MHERDTRSQFAKRQQDYYAWRVMTANALTLIGLGIGVVCVLFTSIVAIRWAGRLGERKPSAPARRDVLDLRLDQLSFDQVAGGQGRAGIAAASGRGDAARITFGIRPEKLIMDEQRPRLRFSMALLNQTNTLVLSIHISSDLVILDQTQDQARPPSAANRRKDHVARLSPGERIIIKDDWQMPDDMIDAIKSPTAKGHFLLARAVITAENMSPTPHYFIFGHLLDNNKLAAIDGSPEALTRLGVSQAHAS